MVFNSRRARQCRRSINLGVYYEIVKNEKKAIEWFLKAAEQGNAVAQSKLGIVYFYGTNGVKRNENKGREWYLKAAEQGHTNAQFNLALSYEDIPMYRKRYRHWLERAAGQGHQPAIIFLLFYIYLIPSFKIS